MQRNQLRQLENPHPPRNRLRPRKKKTVPLAQKASPKKATTTQPVSITGVATAPVAAVAPRPPTQPTGQQQQSFSPIDYQSNNAGISTPLLSQYMMQQHQQHMQAQQPQQMYAYGGNPYLLAQQAAYGAGYGSQYAQGYGNYYGNTAMDQYLQQIQSMAGMSSPTMGGYSQQVPTQTANAFIPPQRQAAAPTASPPISSSSSPSKRSPKKRSKTTKKKEAMPGPPPSLEKQISQQVMANMAAAEKNQPMPHTVPPPEAFEYQPVDDGEDEVEFDEEPIDMSEESDIPKDKKSSKGLVTAIVVAIVSYLLVQSGKDLVGASNAASCFIDNTPINENGDILSSCTDGNGVPCPDGGSCMYGKLVECPSKYYEVSEDETKCVLTDISKLSLSAIRDLLEDLTVKEGCLNEMPMFDYKEIQLSNPSVLATNPLELHILENEFKTERRDGVFYIGLPKDYILKSSYRCWMIGTLKSFLAALGSLFVFGCNLLIMAIWETFKSHPIASIIGVVVGFMIKRIYNYRSYRLKLAKDVADVRKKAYEYLEEFPQPHVALHVRDHIVMKHRKSKRQYLRSDVWPCVVPDLKYDNRIRKSTSVIDGELREVWQWVAASTAAKKKVAIQ